VSSKQYCGSISNLSRPYLPTNLHIELDNLCRELFDFDSLAKDPSCNVKPPYENVVERSITLLRQCATT
jgi:hypothetical protein